MRGWLFVIFLDSPEKRAAGARHDHFYDSDPSPKVGYGATKHNKIIDPVLRNGPFLQNPGLEPSDLAVSCLKTVPEAKMEELANLGASSLIRRFLIRDTSL